MKNKPLIGIILIGIALTGILTPIALAENLQKSDFLEQSFAKTVDYFDYVRAYAEENGLETPANFSQWHANLYATYVNYSGLNIFYAGLENITTDEQTYLTIPMQSFLMHYKTTSTKDVILASTFLMLLAFNETDSSLYPNSPDQNDVLYASFNLGFDLSALNTTLPILNSKTETIPLTKSPDNLQWTWGMRYTNLTALWWRTWVAPNNPRFDNSWPIAITVYDELTFTYNLNIDPITGTATLQENHDIGRMLDLIVGILPILWTHYNSTGMYGMAGRKLGDETIYDYIPNNGLKMSIINFQTSIMADHSTYSTTISGAEVTQTDTQVSSGSINTYADDDEKISTTDFGAKQTYKLYNYTDDPTETTFNSYDSVTRTISANAFHIGLMKLLPLVVVHMNPELYAKAIDSLSNINKANYWYTIAYPEYSGYKIEHDPLITAYLTLNEPTESPSTASSSDLSPSPTIQSPAGQSANTTSAIAVSSHNCDNRSCLIDT